MAGNNNKFDKSQAIFEFYKNYANVVMPVLKDEESFRKSQLFILSLVIIVFLPCTIYLLCIPATRITMLFCVPLLIMIFLSVWIVSDFKKRLKQRCMPLLLRAFGDMTWINNDNTIISDVDLQQSELFGTFNRRSSDDVFVGEYKGVSYSVCETDLRYESGTGRRKMVWPVFSGVVISFDSNKLVRNKTIITTKGDVNVRNSHPLLWLVLISIFVQIFPYFKSLAFIKHVLSSMWPYLLIAIGLLIVTKFYRNKNSEILNEIKLEDPEFEKRYKAYSSDQIEGRYLITPTFMERFRTLHTSFGTSKAKCSFYGNKVMFAISSRKNLFEIGDIFTPLTNPKQINIFLSEISAIFDLIDYFKLDEKTGV